MRKPASREMISACVENCVKLKSVSCTSNLLAPTCDFRKCTRVHLTLILSLLGLPQNQNLEPILICIVVHCFHVAILSEFTCVVNVRNQTSQPFVTSSGPFGHCSCKFVY